jgi:predicted RNA polymerase sigma factor
VKLNYTVAVAMAQGAQAGLALLAELEASKELAGDHRLSAVRAHLLELSGDRAAARAAFEAAARQATNLIQQRYLHTRARRLQQ